MAVRQCHLTNVRCGLRSRNVLVSLKHFIAARTSDYVTLKAALSVPHGNSLSCRKGGQGECFRSPPGAVEGVLLDLLTSLEKMGLSCSL